MKKILAILLIIIISISSFVSCEDVRGSLSDLEDVPFFPSNPPEEDGGEEESKTYKAFTPAEKALFMDFVGEVIPFIENDEYYVEDTREEYGDINFYVVGATEAEFAAYRAMYMTYEPGNPYEDDGITYYVYSKSGYAVEMAYLYYEKFDAYIIDVYVYPISESGDDDGGSGSTGGGSDTDEKAFTDFTEAEKALFTDFVGEVIPFIENNEYYVEDTREEYGDINFYVVGATEAEFAAYLAMYSSYEFIETYDYEGVECHVYGKGDFEVDLSYFYYEDYGEYIIDVYVYLAEDSGDNSGDDSDVAPVTNATLSFSSTSNRVSAGASSQVWRQNGITFTNSKASSQSDVNPAHYNPVRCYQGSSITVEASGIVKIIFNCNSSEYATSLKNSITSGSVSVSGSSVTVVLSSATNSYTISSLTKQVRINSIEVYYNGSGNSGDSGNSGGTGGGSTYPTDVITNRDKGLPRDSDGVYDVDFTKATRVKNVTDQGYYLDGCPTTGSPAVLVIPVDFSDVKATSKGYDISSIVKAFSGSAGDTDYYSVHDYYYISSYGKLDLDITVVDYWFRPQYTSTYYKNQTMDYYGTETAIGDQLVLDEALAELSKTMDLSAFDSDKNGIIDAVVLVTTLEIDEDSDFNWAYRYWNIYTDDDGYYYEYDGVSANDYLWASYQFLYEDENGGFDDEGAMNTYTFIHEFGHILGADDYYDTSYEGSVMDGYDIMDGMLGDHNAFTKFNLGWLTASRLVVTDSSVTLTLEDFSKNGDTIILANNWDDTLGAYQEYYVIVYYTNNGLNSGNGGYFLADGIVVYHVNSVLYKDVQDGETYYDIYNNNTSPTDDYGTEDNLIEFVKTAGGNYVFTVGATLPTVTDDFGDELAYTFTVDSLTADTATITFNKTT